MNEQEKRSPVSQVTISGDQALKRLDNFLLGHLKGLPRPRIYRMIRSGEVRVNKRRAKPSYRLARGDIVRVPPAYGVGGGHRPPPTQARSGWITQHIVYEDSDLLVLDKPSGLAVHGGSGISFGAIELLRAAMPQQRNLELAHRLDRDTSGCLLIAKRRSSLRKLHQMFREGQVKKTYLALLQGQWTGGAREIISPLRTDHRKGGERHVRVDPEGKPAFTKIAPQKCYAAATFVSVQILTGRTHQIRVHAAEIGHPVAGDTRYGPGDQSLERELQLQRLFLHASSLVFRSPGEDTKIVVEAPLEDSLRAVLRRLETDPEPAAGQDSL